MVNHAFADRAAKIPGWLSPVTAHRTVDILLWQKEQGISGGILEIGVFAGKYFSLLVASTAGTTDRVVGIDTFEYVGIDRVNEELNSVFDGNTPQTFMLWKGFSSEFKADDIIKEVGSCRFVSVDGAHDYENVFGDLVLTESVLSKHGIVAIDDFINPLTLGVNMAVNQFLAVPRAVVPVAYISNKLFLAHRASADAYRSAIEQAIAGGSEPESDFFREQLTHGRHHVEQLFYGHKVILS